MATKTEKREFRRFTLVGFTATVIDFAILNLLTHVFATPIVVANIASTSTSSLYSYILNRKFVFKTIAHGERKSLVLYVVSVLISIFIIQSSIIALLGRGVTEGWFEALGATGDLKNILAVNIAKIIAGLAGMAWNFYSQRRFVFASNSPKHN